MDDAIAINATTQPGKKVDATSFARGQDTVYRERVVFGDDAGAIIASFPVAQPATNTPAIPIRQVGLPAFPAVTFDNVVVSGNGQQLPAHACSVVRLKAPTSNSGNVWIGSTSAVAVDNGWELFPGDEVELPITNSNLLYATPDTGSQKLQLIAL